MTDFGLARRGPGSDLTRTHAVMGTPAYMAPEQARGGGKFAGPQADVWALGVMLYECAAGKRPFAAETGEALLARVQSADPAALRAAPRDLRTVVARCLAKEPERRYPTAAELADDLGRFARGEPVRARPVGRSERLYRWARRKPAAAAAYALSALAAGLAAVVFVVAGFWREAEDANRTKDEALGDKDAALRAKDAALDLAARERERAAVVDYGRTVQLAHRAWRDGNPAGAAAILDGTPERLRGWEWHYVRRLCNPAPLYTLPGLRLPLSPQSVHWSPDGARFAAASDGSVRVIDAATGRELAALDGAAEVVPFSPDGSRFLTRKGPTARLWDAATWKPVADLDGVGPLTWSRDGSRVLGVARRWDARTGAELPTRYPAVTRPAAVTRQLCHDGATVWNPDGTLVAVAAHADLFGYVCGGVGVYDVATGEQKLWLPGGWGLQKVVAWSPDGGRLLTGAGGVYRLWDTGTGRPLPLRYAMAERAASVERTTPLASFSADGRRVVLAGTHEARLRVWDADGRGEAAVPDGVRAVDRSPRGDLAVADYHDGARRVIDPRTWREAEAWKGREAPPPGARWSPDGEWVAAAGVAADNSVRAWETRTGREAVLRGHGGGVGVLAWAPNGSRLATGSADKTARVWDPATGRAVALAGHAQEVRSVTWSPDGTRLLTLAGDGTARVWDADTGAELAALPTPQPSCEAPPWSPDGRRLVLAAAGEARDGRRPGYVVWDATTWKPAHTFPAAGSAGYDTPVWGPDGKRLLVPSAPRGLGVWDPATWTEAAVLTQHQGAYLRAAWSPDGTRVLTADGVDVSVWDPATGAQLAHLAVPGGSVEAAAWHPAGRRVLTRSRELAAARHETVTLSHGPHTSTTGSGRESVSVARVWDADSGTLLRTLAGTRRAGPGTFRADDGTAVASWTPDGAQLWVYHQEPTAAVFDAGSGARLAGLAGHRAPVVRAVLSPDGTRVVTIPDGTERAARVWDAATGVQLAVLEGHANTVASAEWSRDGTRVVTTSGDMTARLWDAATGRQLMRLWWVHGGSTPFPGRGGLSPDGTRFLSLAPAGIEVWDVRAAQAELRSPGHVGTLSPAVRAVPVGGNNTYTFRGGGLAWAGDRLVTAGADGAVRVWDPVTGREAGVLRGHAGAVTAVAAGPGGRELVTASADGTARVWDGRTLRLLGVLDGHRAALTGAAFSPDGNRVVTFSVDGTARVWDTPPGDLLPRRPVAVLDNLARPESVNEVTSAAWSPDGTRLVLGTRAGPARVWDARTWRPAGAVPEYRPTGVSWSPRGDRVLVTSRRDTTNDQYEAGVSLWDPAAGRQVGQGVDTSDGPKGTAWSPDGRLFVVAGSGAAVLDADTGKEVTRLARKDRGTYLGSMSAGPSSNGFDTAHLYKHDGRGRRVDWTETFADEKAARRALFERGVGDGGAHDRRRFASFSPDGTRALTGSDDGCRVWDVAGGEQRCVLWEFGAGEFTDTVWSPDGAQVATGHADGSVRVWDAGAGKLLATMPPAHTGAVASAAWHPDGSRVLTVGFDGLGCVWDVRTGGRVATLPVGPRSSAPVLAWHPGGALVAAGTLGRDGLRISDPATGRTVGETKSGRYLSGADWPTGQWPDGTDVRLTATRWRHRPSSPGGWSWETMPTEVLATTADGSREVFVRKGEAQNGRDEVVRDAEVRDAGTKAVVAVLRGHAGAVFTAAFSPDGSRVVTWGRDNTVRVWHAGTGAELLALEGEPDGLSAARFRFVSWSPDGHRILTAALTRDVKILDATPLGR